MCQFEAELTHKMLPLSSTQVTNGSHEADDYRRNVEYPRYCDLCTRNARKLSNRFEFVQHLRAMHCTKEGGSFICRYVFLFLSFLVMFLLLSFLVTI